VAQLSGEKEDIRIFVVYQKEKDPLDDQGVGGWIILRWIFGSQNGVGCTGLFWLRIGTSEKPL
jgi:hypothetical protein